MTKSEFTSKVAEDIVMKQHPGAKNWPLPNLWAFISTVKWQIDDEQIPKLMRVYRVKQLEDFQCKTELL